MRFVFLMKSNGLWADNVQPVGMEDMLPFKVAYDADGRLEGDGTMLDNTVIIYTSDNGETHHSSGVNFPLLILVDLGGRLKRGRYFAPGNQRDNKDEEGFTRLGDVWATAARGRRPAFRGVRHPAQRRSTPADRVAVSVAAATSFQTQPVGLVRLFPKVALAGVVAFLGEVGRHHVDEAPVVAAAFGAGPVAAVDQALRAEGFPDHIERRAVGLDVLRRWLGVRRNLNRRGRREGLATGRGARWGRGRAS